MQQTKSPFIIIPDFISPLMCEEIIDLCDFTIPDTDKDGDAIMCKRNNEQVEQMIYTRLLPLLPELQSYYEFKYKGTEPILVEWYPEGSKGEFMCENSNFLRQKWVRTKQRDFTAVLFLCDFQDKVPFEEEFEVYGGRLEFPQWNFSVNPQRGTLIIFPSEPHFINITSPMFAGDAFQVKVQIAAESAWLFNPDKFPGNPNDWFTEYMPRFSKKS